MKTQIDKVSLISAEVLIFDAITKAISHNEKTQSTDKMGACLNLAPTLRKYADFVECGIWPLTEPPDA